MDKISVNKAKEFFKNNSNLELVYSDGYTLSRIVKEVRSQSIVFDKGNGENTYLDLKAGELFMQGDSLAMLDYTKEVMLYKAI